MSNSLRLLLAQINPTVGAIKENAELILDIIEKNASKHDILLFPELALTGYPPEDLLFRPEFHQTVETYLAIIQAASTHCHVIVGHPELLHGQCFNTASVFYEGKCLAHYHKQCLPNYGIFDEKRYFTPGEKRACILTVKGIRMGLCICEDLWRPGPVELLLHADIQGILAINASPFDSTKYQQRLETLRRSAQQGVFMVYLNLVGGQDELVFDGQSLVLDAQGEIQARGPAFEPSLQTVIIHDKNIYPQQLGFRLGATEQAEGVYKQYMTDGERGCNNAENSSAKSIEGKVYPEPEPIAALYQALMLGTRDYVQKNGFKKVILGLSGGIDSALTLAIAADAIGPEQVHAVKMPSRYTHTMSNEDADIQLQALHISSTTLSIEPAFETLLKTLHPIFLNAAPDVTEENIQARIRCILLMAIANKKEYLLLSTSNKSELAMGYSTLYGDMAGGFAVLKDVFKTQVYQLAHYRNSLSQIIPERVLTRAPSAELAPHQTDQDTLPPYETLDAILEAYMVHGVQKAELLKQGFKSQDINFILSRLQRNEYKRRQAPPGPKISPRAFGRDWRMPLTNGGHS